VRYIRHNPTARHCRSGNYNLRIPMASDSVSWNIGGVMVWIITFGLAGYLCFKAWGFLVTIGKLSFWLLRIMI
jgi:hypothetical protein